MGQVSVLIRAALLGDGDWQYHVLKRENSFPCLLRLNVIGCFRSQGYKMGGRPSCAPQCHFQRGLNSVSHRHTFDLRNVRVYVSGKTSAPISKARHERNIHLLLERYLKDHFFPFFLFLKAQMDESERQPAFPLFYSPHNLWRWCVTHVGLSSRCSSVCQLDA